MAFCYGSPNRWGQCRIYQCFSSPQDSSTGLTSVHVKPTANTHTHRCITNIYLSHLLPQYIPILYQVRVNYPSDIIQLKVTRGSDGYEVLIFAIHRPWFKTLSDGNTEGKQGTQLRASRSISQITEDTQFPVCMHVGMHVRMCACAWINHRPVSGCGL